MTLPHSPLRTLRNVAALTAVAFSACGCALYSETRDKQGQALKDAYAKVDLKNQIEVPRKNRAAILEQQLSTVDMLARIQRDGIIRAVATGTAPGHTVLARLNLVSGLSGADGVLGAPAGSQDDASLKPREARIQKHQEWLQAANSADELRRYIRDTIEPQFVLFALSPLTCDDIANKTQAKKALDKWLDQKEPSVDGPVRVTLHALEEKCTHLNGHLLTLKNTSVAVELGAVLKSLDQERAQFDNLRSRTAALRTEIGTALLERNDADTQGQGDRVRAAAEKLQALLSKLKRADDVFSIQFLADKEQDALNEFLTTVKDTPAGKAPPTDSSKAAMALVLFPDLFDQTRKQLTDADKASLLPLVLQKNLSKIKYDSATREIETRRLRIDLLQKKESLLREQVAKFIEIDRLLQGDQKSPPKLAPSLLAAPMVDILAPPDKSGSDTSGKFTVEQRMDIWKVVATYIDVGVRKGSEINKIELRLNALDDEILLGYSEANITQWNTLLSASVDQLAAYGATGIKSEQISTLINNLTLLWIGAGVN